MPPLPPRHASLPLDAEKLRAPFTNTYGVPGPTPPEGRALYDEDVYFEDPTQSRQGVEAYIQTQQGLENRCDDIFLEPGAVAVNGDQTFLEWRMGLKIKGIEFLYPGVTRLRFGADGRIVEHRDYLNFVGPIFAPVSVVGGFMRWLYGRLVS
jgi:hypothetical protein